MSASPGRVILRDWGRTTLLLAALWLAYCWIFAMRGGYDGAMIGLATTPFLAAIVVAAHRIARNTAGGDPLAVLTAIVRIGGATLIILVALFAVSQVVYIRPDGYLSERIAMPLWRLVAGIALFFYADRIAMRALGISADDEDAGDAPDAG